MKRFQLLTTAIFLFCTLLIAGCTGRGVEAQATAAPEATPTATADIMSGIQTGDSAVNKILAGTWTFERTDADKKTDEGSASQILPSTDTGAKETTDVKEPGTIRELTFRTNGTGTYTDANGTPLAFEFALNGDNLTLSLENGTVRKRSAACTRLIPTSRSRSFTPIPAATARSRSWPSTPTSCTGRPARPGKGRKENAYVFRIRLPRHGPPRAEKLLVARRRRDAAGEHPRRDEQQLHPVI